MTEFKKLTLKQFPKPPLRRSPESAYWRTFKFPVLINETATPTCIDFSPIAPHDFAVTSAIKVEIFDALSLRPKATITQFQDRVFSARFRGDGKLLVTGGARGVQIFDIRTRGALRHFTTARGPVHTAFFAADRMSVVAGADDGTVRFYDVPSGDEVASLPAHKDYCRCVAQSPHSESVFASGGYDHILALWDRTSNTQIRSFNHGGPIESICFLSSGSLVATAGGNTVKIWDIMASETERPLHTATAHQKAITCVAMDGTHSRLMTGGIDGYVKVHNISDFKVTHAMKYPGPITSLQCSPGNGHLVVGLATPLLSIRRRESEPSSVPVLPSLASRSLAPGADIRSDPKLQGYGLHLLGQPQRRRGRRYFGAPSGPVTASAEDFQVTEKRRKRLTQYEKLLKSFEYGKALDAAIATKNVVIAVSMFTELIHQNALMKAIKNRTEESLEPIVHSVLRHICNPKYSSVLIDVANVILNHSRHFLGQSAVIDQLFLKLQQRVSSEARLQESLMQTMGMLEAALFAAPISDEISSFGAIQS